MKVTMAELLGKVSAKEGHKIEMEKLERENKIKHAEWWTREVILPIKMYLTKKLGREPVAQEWQALEKDIAKKMLSVQETLERDISKKEIREMMELYAELELYLEKKQ